MPRPHSVLTAKLAIRNVVHERYGGNSIHFEKSCASADISIYVVKGSYWLKSKNTNPSIKYSAKINGKQPKIDSILYHQSCLLIVSSIRISVASSCQIYTEKY